MVGIVIISFGCGEHLRIATSLDRKTSLLLTNIVVAHRLFGIIRGSCYDCLYALAFADQSKHHEQKVKAMILLLGNVVIW